MTIEVCESTKLSVRDGNANDFCHKNAPQVIEEEEFYVIFAFPYRHE
jgi:hypothetical protein